MPSPTARELRLLPLWEDDGAIVVASPGPPHIDTLDEAVHVLGRPVLAGRDIDIATSYVEVDEPHVVSKHIDELERHGQRDARLSDSAGTDEREQAGRTARRRDQLANGGDILLPTQQGCRRHR